MKNIWNAYVHNCEIQMTGIRLLLLIFFFFFQFIVSLLLCLLDWCMALPLQTLLEPISTSPLEDSNILKPSLLDYIYRVCMLVDVLYPAPEMSSTSVMWLQPEALHIWVSLTGLWGSNGGLCKWCDLYVSVYREKLLNY